MQSVNNYRASKEPIQSLSSFHILRERERGREGGFERVLIAMTMEFRMKLVKNR